MNVFLIPSWYPSVTHPSTGVFHKEQAQLMARHRPEWNVGISTWGSHEPKYWIRKSRPLEALIKYFLLRPGRPKDQLLEPNCVELFTPAFTWTRKWREGNIAGIYESNKKNLDRFTQTYGRPDIIHAHVAHPGGYVAMLMAKEFDIPYVLTEHMSPFPMPSFKKDFRKWLLPPLKNASAVLSVGENLTKELAASDIHAVPVTNYVDTIRFAPSEQHHGEPVIFALGRLEEQKGFDLLIKALAQMNGEGWKLRLGGIGSEKKRLQRMIHDSGLEDKVEMLGELDRDQVADEMKHCDFFVLSSRHESFGVVVAEALACGKPVVYTRCGGVTDQLTAQVGVACDISATGLQQGLQLMIKNHKTYDSQIIRQFAEDRYAPAVAVENLEGIYRSVITAVNQE